MNWYGRKGQAMIYGYIRVSTKEQNESRQNHKPGL